HLLDLSKAMLTEAIKKFKDQKNVYYLGNGSNLPFADNSFDALLHVGGINTFTDIEGALQEFARVTKQGGKILVCDEGIADHLLNTSYGKIGVQFNTLYKSKPPIDKLPSTARNVRVSYVLGGFFYCIEFIKGREYEFNLEAIMPGQNITLGEFFKKNKAKLDSI
ncbi:MAG: class I SAM-dependent methyltransferase, partial [Candidatus Hodarchaeota archaeon]